MKWLALFLLAGCAAPVDAPEGAWHGRDLDPATWNQWDLKPCQVIELDFRYDETTEFNWDWVSNNEVPLQFNVHTHAGNGVVDIINVTRTEMAGTLTFEAGETYSMVWTNPQAETATLWHLHDVWLRGTLAAVPPEACAPEATPM